MLALLLLACQPKSVQITGTVATSRLDDAPLAGATVQLRDHDFRSRDEAVTDDAGRFEVIAPFQSSVFIVVSGEGLVPVSFPGTSGASEALEVPEGQLWGLPQAEEDGWRATFAGCTNVEEPGMIVGEVRLWLPGSDISNPESIPVDPSGYAFVEAAEMRTDACYLDAAGGAYDPAAEQVGASGRFALFGFEGGPLRVVAGRAFGEGASLVSEWSVYVPEGGAVSLHPALVEL